MENFQLNLERIEDCRIAVKDADVVYNLAADTGGMGFIELNKALCMLSEKAPAAVCRKVINAKLTGQHDIEIWGDGHQTRSFMFISDCLKGTQMLTESDFVEPINIGSNELVSINQLVDIVEEIAGIKLARRYNLGAPKGVNGRNSDNTLIQTTFGWQPSTKLRDGLEITYRWIYDEMQKVREGGAVSVVNRA